MRSLEPRKTSNFEAVVKSACVVMLLVCGYLIFLRYLENEKAKHRRREIENAEIEARAMENLERNRELEKGMRKIRQDDAQLERATRRMQGF